MIRRALVLTASAIAATAASLAVAAPAQAATVDIPFGPLSIGDYCHAAVSTTAWIGFYEGAGLRCYQSGTGTSLQYVGQANPYLACKYLTTDVVMSAFRGTSDALVCRVIR
jgi:hypothetical protein